MNAARIQNTAFKHASFRTTIYSRLRRVWSASNRPQQSALIVDADRNFFRFASASLVKAYVEP